MSFEKAKILKLIHQGENTSVEFKTQEVRAEGLAKEIAAFANTDGGIILIGVADNKTIQGVSDEKNYEEWIANIARNNLIPSIRTDFSLITIEGEKIAVVLVPKGKDKPYQTKNGKYYIRVGSTNRITTQTELLRLFQATGYFHYDLTPIFGTGLKDLNLSKLDDYFKRYNLDFSTENENQKTIFLQNTDILTVNGETTIAGLLIFGINPSRHLYQNGISFARIRGKTMNEELLDKQNIDGNLDYQIDTGIAVLKNHLAVPSRIIGAKRVDTKYLSFRKKVIDIYDNM